MADSVSMLIRNNIPGKTSHTTCSGNSWGTIGTMIAEIISQFPKHIQNTISRDISWLVSPAKYRGNSKANSQGPSQLIKS